MTKHYIHPWSARENEREKGDRETSLLLQDFKIYPSIMRNGKRSFAFNNSVKKPSPRTLSTTRSSTSMRSLYTSGHFATATPSTSNTTTGDSPSFIGSQRSLGWGGGGVLETGLHYGKLEELLCVRIPMYFKKIKSSQFHGLASASTRKQKDLLRPAICYLDDALAAAESKDFNFEMLVDIQSSLGMIYDIQGDSRTAIDYFMSALWLLHKPFKSRGCFAKGYDLNTQVAINLYRLGACYGKLGDIERMQEAFDRAECFREGDIFIAAVRA
eukprot:scaffold18373_cov154-Amphora_coffeaeformis.AAC.1